MSVEQDVNCFLATAQQLLADGMRSRKGGQPVKVVDFLALYARRRHGRHTAAASRLLAAALGRIGTCPSTVTVAGLAARIRTARRYEASAPDVGEALRRVKAVASRTYYGKPRSHCGSSPAWTRRKPHIVQATASRCSTGSTPSSSREAQQRPIASLNWGFVLRNSADPGPRVAHTP
ncbi:hypothetical protein [Streptomyces sp. NPDC005438]|uniref:hypothetical protein n=1 Tax=Streptomyces sp. NPDC005438 TaxID=3156880 RepID=UPI0033B7E371